MMNWPTTLRWVVCFVAVLLTVGCTVQSNQFSMLASLVVPQEDALAAYRWRVTLGQYQTVLIAGTAPGKTFFANKKDDFIVFDGWMITEVHGLGLISSLSVQGQVGERVIHRNSHQVGSQNCEAWKLIEQSNETVQEQYCLGEARVLNRITIDAEGQITKIEQHLGFDKHGFNGQGFKEQGSNEFGDSGTITLTKL
jgi:hypothetical protein